jgi:hypothetical protein
MESKLKAAEKDLAKFSSELEANKKEQIDNAQLDPDNVEAGLAKLVLTIIELIRRLLEKEAIKRMKNDSLSPEEIERMGCTFFKLKKRLEELKKEFGLEDEELNLNLGPLGDLM